MKETKKKLLPSELYHYFLEFAHDRHQIFLKRRYNPSALSDNPIIKKYKFTNVYRFLDRTTQYLIHEITNNDVGYSDEDLLFRILLFKIFNKIETWEYLKKRLKDIRWSSFDIDKYTEVMNEMKKNGCSVYSAAYIMPSKISTFNHSRKYVNHLRLIEMIMNNDLVKIISKSKSLEDLYQNLKLIPSFGDFLAYQYSVDINYSRLVNFSENDFVVAGPGAKRGIYKAFINASQFSNQEIIQQVTKNLESQLEKENYDPIIIGNRLPHLIDVQNLFCEFDKYTREIVKNLRPYEKKNMRIKQRFKPNISKIDYVFPNKWGIL